MNKPIIRPVKDVFEEERKEVASLIAEAEQEADRKKSALISYLESCLRNNVTIKVTEDAKLLGLEDLVQKYQIKQGHYRRLSQMLAGSDDDYYDVRSLGLSESLD